MLATLSATEVVRLTAVRLSAVDEPGARRAHQRITPRLGGLSIFWGFAGALLLLMYGSPGPSRPGDFDLGLSGMLVGAALMLIVGLLDDVHQVGAAVKLLAQIGAALVLWSSGWRVEIIGLPGAGSWTLGAAGLWITIGWVVLVTNAINLIDGLDGLACGVALVTCLATGLILWPTDVLMAAVALALAGALLGFLWFNFNPALIFMGDAGSLFVGFVVAAITLRAGQRAGTDAFPLVPALLLAVPLVDTTYAIVRRTLGATRGTRSVVRFLRDLRVRLFAADRGHVHHVLIDCGLSTRRAVVVLWTAALSFALSGCVALRHRPAGLTFAVALAVIWALAYRAARRRWLHIRELQGEGEARVSRQRAQSSPRAAVLVVVNDLGLGGAQSVAVEQASRLHQRGREVHLASLELDSGSEALRHTDPGLPVHRLRRPSESLLVVPIRLMRLLWRLRPAIVHTHLAAAGALARPLARLAGVPRVVTTLHNLSDWEERSADLVRVFDRMTMGDCHGVAAVSEAVRAGAARVLPELAGRMRVVYNGVDAAAFVRDAQVGNRVRQDLGWEAGCLVLGTVARLEPRKDIALLVEAFAEAAVTTPALRLLIVGDGPERAALEVRVGDLKLGDRVHFTGVTSDPRPYFWAMDLFALPSRSEGLGIAAIEALAAGVPVLGSRTGGIPEVLGSLAGGRLVTPGDRDAWREAIVRAALHADERRAMAEAAPVIARCFAHEAGDRALAALYDEPRSAAADWQRAA